jgi:hypothetical protein
MHRRIPLGYNQTTLNQWRITMSISRCNKCGTISEHEREMIGTNFSCVRCATPNPIYDTVLFVNKLLEQYFAQRNELNALRASSPQPQGEEKHSSSIDIHNSDWLSLETQHRPIVDWFSTKSITATINSNAVDTTGFFDEAAVAIGSEYELLGEICERIRYAQQKEYNSALIHLDKKSAEDAKALESFVRKLHEYSLVARYFNNKEEKNLRLILQNAPSVRRFFSGEWLEWFALMTGVRICHERKADFACARNLILSYPPNEKRELDVFFLINKTKPLYIECKTGEFRQDLDKYISLKKKLNIEQKYFIICVSDLDPEQGKGLSAMHGLTFVNVQSLGQHLSTLV